MVTYPEAILDASMEINLIPVDMGNPFQTWLSNGPDCQPSEMLYKRGLECNILANEGVNLLQTAGVFLFTLIVSLSSAKILKWLISRMINSNNKAEEAKKQDTKIKAKSAANSQLLEATKKSKIAKLVRTIGEILGMQFFLVKLEGNQLGFVLASMINLKNSSRYSADIVGTIISIGILLYYFITGFLCFIQSLWIWGRVERLRVVRGNRDYKGHLGKHIALYQSPFPALNFYFDELRVPDHYWQLLTPVVTNLRNIGLCLMVVGVIGKPWQQVTMATLVESLALLYECKANAKANRSEYWSIIIMRVFTILYLLLKNMTNIVSMTDDTRQYKVGLAMVICLVSIMAVGICFAVYTIGVMLIELVRNIIAKIKAWRELKKLLSTQKDEQMMPSAEQDSVMAQLPLDEHKNKIERRINPGPSLTKIINKSKTRKGIKNESAQNLKVVSPVEPLGVPKVALKKKIVEGTSKIRDEEGEQIDRQVQPDSKKKRNLLKKTIQNKRTLLQERISNHPDAKKKFAADILKKGASKTGNELSIPKPSEEIKPAEKKRLGKVKFEAS